MVKMRLRACVYDSHCALNFINKSQSNRIHSIEWVGLAHTRSQHCANSLMTWIFLFVDFSTTHSPVLTKIFFPFAISSGSSALKITIHLYHQKSIRYVSVYNCAGLKILHQKLKIQYLQQFVSRYGFRNGFPILLTLIVELVRINGIRILVSKSRGLVDDHNNYHDYH